MDTSPALRTSLLVLSFVGMSAHAEWRCDCSTVLDTCNATVTAEDSWVSIESDHRQCARVDYLIDGLPFVALVIEGSERQSWLSQSDNPQVVVQSCQVCVDNADTGSDFGASAERATANSRARTSADPSFVLPSQAAARIEPSRLISVDPRYPASAASRGIDGFAEVTFTVTAAGRVANAVVTAAEPPGVFDDSALTAISKWRYDADEGRAAVTLSHRFDFDLEDALVALSARSNAAPETVVDDLIARLAERRDGDDTEFAAGQPYSVESIDRNYCIREQASYDFGETIEVDLMNACSEPLIVFSCAEGTGRYHRRWVCRSSERAQSILVRPGDRLAGNAALIEVPDGVSTFTYAEALLVDRAPNSEYWWLACVVDDAECRGSGRMWVRSMDRKAANVDPQLWTQQTVTRSY